MGAVAWNLHDTAQAVHRCFTHLRDSSLNMGHFVLG